MRLSKRSIVDSFIVMDVLEAAARAEAEGRHIIHMEIGQPGTPAPEGARRALAGAMEGGQLGYTVALGLPALREKIAALYGERHDVDLSPERVIVTAGSSGAFLLAFTALVRRRRPRRARRTRLPLLPPDPERPQPHPGRYRNAHRRPLSDDARQPARRHSGADRGLSGQSVGHNAGQTRPCRIDRGECGAECGLRVRRDLPRFGIWPARGLGAGSLRRGLRDQFLLQVLLDDRLARRLDGRARRPRAHHRASRRRTCSSARPMPARWRPLPRWSVPRNWKRMSPSIARTAT